MDKIFSSKQVAGLLGVNESSVKRWADNGMLSCYKTPGGHRKFRENDILQFSNKYSYELKKNITLNPEPVNMQKKSFDFEKIKKLLLMKLLKSTDDEIMNYFYSLHISGLSVTDLYDNVISGAMKKIGDKWKRKEISIEDEHISTSKIIKALIKFHGKLEPNIKNGLTAFCGCPEKEYHELPLLSVNNFLQYKGWNTIYAGVNLPVKSFISGIKLYKPDLVCLSATIAEDKERFLIDIKKIYNAAKNSGAYFVIGGSAVKSLSDIKGYCDSIILSISDLHKFIKDKFSV